MKHPKKNNVIPYQDRKDAFITITEIIEPYGPQTETVISIGCTLKGQVDSPTWKVHIPKHMLPEVIDTLSSLVDDEEKK